MHWVTATSYVVAQIVGAIFAAGLLYGTIPGAANSDLGALRLNPGECCPRSRAAPASE
jgi:glycerol uptake facilitator-like aquaporin